MDDNDNPDEAPAAMDTGLRALVALICNLNPYTGVKDASAGTTTEEMVIGDWSLSDLEARLRSIPVDLETNYATTWSFKGQPQTVKAAFRVPYTFKVKNTDGGTTRWWQTEHLLIGFAGADGGG